MGDFYKKLRRKAEQPLLIARGTMSHREGTTNVVVSDLKVIQAEDPGIKAKNWG